MNRAKRDIFRFNGEKPTAINLEHVTHMSVEGKRLSFYFYTDCMSVDVATEEDAKNCFETLLNLWVADAVDKQQAD
jgi:hypothetical protein